VKSSFSVPYFFFLFVSRLEDESRLWRFYESVDRLSNGRSFERLLQIVRRIDRLAQRRTGQRGDRRERVGNLALRLINEWRQRSSLLFVGEPPLSSKRSSL